MFGTSCAYFSQLGQASLANVRTLEAVNDVMMHPGMLRRFHQQSAQDRDCLGGPRPFRLLVGQRKPAHDHQRQVELRLHFVRILREQRAHAGDECLFRILRGRIAASGHGGDVQLLQIGGLSRDGAQFDRLLRGGARARHRRRSLLPGDRLQQIDLEARTPVAGGHHRDAPLRHRRGGVERGGLQE